MIKENFDPEEIELYSRWKEIQLRDISSDISYGYTASATSENIGPKFLRITDITSGSVNWETVPFCRISEKDNQKYKLGVGDIVIARTGATTGYNSIIKKEVDAVYASYLIRFQIDKKKANPFFVGYVLQSNNFQNYVDAIAGGSAQPGANAQQFADYKFTIPPLKEQTAIAAILTSLDDKIDLLHRQNKTLEQLAETLFRQWFVEEAEESWETKKVSEIIEIRDGTHDSPKQTETGRFLITSKHLKPTGIDYSSAYKISEDDFIEVNKRSKVDKDDILFSMIGTLGLIHYVDQEPDFAIKNMGLFKSSQKPSFARFLFLLLISPEGKRFVYENADGSTQEYITLGSLRKFEFKYPGEKKIIEFDLEIKPIFQKIKSNQTQIHTLTQTRDNLLPKLMSGVVRVNL
jgi:type I restriction enzyme, S subunit